MNRKEWKLLRKTDSSKAFFWYNKVKKKVKLKEFENDYRTDKNADTIHHLRDTEEQRKYNDEHYEMFGFELDENGNAHFEYGKYVVFWTQDHHRQYHCRSEDTRAIIGKTSKEHWLDKNYRQKVLSSMRKSWANDHDRRHRQSLRLKGVKLTDQHRLKLRLSKLGSKNPMFGKHPSKETLEKRGRSISAAMTEDVRRRISEHMPDRHGENNPLFGKISPMRGQHHSDETRKLISERTKEALNNEQARSKLSSGGKKGGKVASERSLKYLEYRSKGGTLRWNEFQSAMKSVAFEDLLNDIINSSLEKK